MQKCLYSFGLKTWNQGNLLIYLVGKMFELLEFKIMRKLIKNFFENLFFFFEKNEHVEKNVQTPQETCCLGGKNARNLNSFI